MGQYREVQLGEVVEFIRGTAFKPEDRVPFGSAGSVACFRTKNIQGDLNQVAAIRRQQLSGMTLAEQALRALSQRAFRGEL